MHSYIVRIYQRDASRLVGVVESTGSEEQAQVFHNAGELWRILSDPRTSTADHPEGKTLPDGTD